MAHETPSPLLHIPVSRLRLWISIGGYGYYYEGYERHLLVQNDDLIVLKGMGYYGDNGIIGCAKFTHGPRPQYRPQ